MDWFANINPLTHVSAGEYATFWQTLFATLFLGIWSRTFASLLLVLSFWFGVRRRNWILGFWTFVGAGSLAYGAAFMRFLGLLAR
ncbi:hypothetical protein EDC39_11267 [Geothermobacter ehrlichii]|uniref:Uncharacterized protein n=1 Tax=Geothermobacter ehrlichii TaxID=213224 RepID=A0A5D3WHS2_9BACT|nr:hypothetical protein [Geothermobacter ehrlichii]TYO96779.1 hypothetical protein EDC39_11267 [Geothermobacter ehrlichii]